MQQVQGAASCCMDEGWAIWPNRFRPLRTSALDFGPKGNPPGESRGGHAFRAVVGSITRFGIGFGPIARGGAAGCPRMVGSRTIVV